MNTRRETRDTIYYLLQLLLMQQKREKLRAYSMLDKGGMIDKIIDTLKDIGHDAFESMSYNDKYDLLLATYHRAEAMHLVQQTRAEEFSLRVTLRGKRYLRDRESGYRRSRQVVATA